jgi:hypothetical protein
MEATVVSVESDIQCPIAHGLQLGHEGPRQVRIGSPIASLHLRFLLDRWGNVDGWRTVEEPMRLQNKGTRFQDSSERQAWLDILKRPGCGASLSPLRSPDEGENNELKADEGGGAKASPIAPLI